MSGANVSVVDKSITAPFGNTLKALRISDEQIGGYMYDLSLPFLDELTRDKLAGDGLEVAEQFADEAFEIVEFEQFLTYGKRYIVLYMRDQFLTAEKYQRGELKPFHICWCDTLRAAKEKNRYESRYVMTYNIGGNFKVNLSVRDKDDHGRPYTEKKEQNV